MDTLTVGSLFAGIGGFDLGLERAGMQVKWQVEIDPYCLKVLEKHWPHVKRYTDIKTVDWSGVEPVDLVCGGFPCQDLSVAGKRAGIDGERSGLWSEYVRCLRALRPRYVLVENVPGLLANPAMGRVLGDLAESGYDAEWDCLPASAFGSHHLRDRIWIIAYPYSERRDFSVFASGGLRQIERTQFWKSFRGIDNSLQVQEYASICGVLDGLSARMDGRLHAIGNAVVPQVVEWIGRQIVKAEEALTDQHFPPIP